MLNLLTCAPLLTCVPLPRFCSNREKGKKKRTDIILQRLITVLPVLLIILKKKKSSFNKHKYNNNISYSTLYLVSRGNYMLSKSTI